MGRLGAHVSVSGGVANSVQRALDLDLMTFQIFSRNQRQWTPPPLPDDDVNSFKGSLNETSLGPILVHASYLINPASPDEKMRDRSVSALADELGRCSSLGLERLVLHPGAHKGSGKEEGIRNIGRTIDEAYSRLHETHENIQMVPTVLLETTAGQGTGLGSTFSEIGDMIGATSRDNRPGVCLDTCHMHSAGYDLLTKGSYMAVMDDLEGSLGSENVLGIHLNDSLRELGSHIDRHANIGEGTMGTEPFRLLLNDNRFFNTPMILETPGGDEGYEKDLSVLRSLVIAR